MGLFGKSGLADSFLFLDPSLPTHVDPTPPWIFDPGPFFCRGPGGFFGDFFHPTPVSHLVPTVLDGTVDVSATDGHGHMLFGSGNPTNHYQIQHNAPEGIEGFLGMFYRQGNSIPVYSVDNHGVLQVYVPTGPQVVDPAHGVFAANPNRAAWSFNFGVDALGSNTLDQYDIHLTVNNLHFHLEKAPAGNPTHSQSGYVWVNEATHQIAFGDDGGVLNHVSENSENVAFLLAAGLDADPNTPGVQPYTNAYGPATFNIELTAVKHNDAPLFPWLGKFSPMAHHDTTVIDIHEQVHVVAPTDPHIHHDLIV